MNEVDSQGRCLNHPFVQISRRSRQGDWKVLLDSCPLCAIDRECTEECNVDDNNAKTEKCSPAELEANGYVKPRSRSVPKVKFAADNVSQEMNPYVISLPTSQPYPLNFSDSSIKNHGNSVSFASNSGSIPRCSALKQPKYKVCQAKMKQNLEAVENVTTMSMDLDMDEEDDNDKGWEQIFHPPYLHLQLSKVESKREDQDPRAPVKNEYISMDLGRNKSTKGRKPSNKRPQIRNSLLHISPKIRPDPEEFPCIVGSCHQAMPRIPSTPTSPIYNAGPSTTITTPTIFDDEVSALSFAESAKCQSLPSRSHSNTQQQNPTAAVEAEVLTNKKQETSSADCINTNNFDSKGRCSNHPQIRLRKKKLFGRGWKVLMNACPDCCVEELRRLSMRRSLEYRGDGSVHSAPLPVRENSNKSIETASLTASNTSSISDRSTSKDSRTEFINMEQSTSSSKKRDKEVILVRQMRWLDENGISGLYTGEVDAQFNPHGSGVFDYNEGTVTRGKWKHGIYRPKRGPRSNSRSSRSSTSRRSRSQSKTRVSGSGRSRSSSRSSSVTRTRSRSMSVQPSSFQ